jgi:hypothetical protein
LWLINYTTYAFIPSLRIKMINVPKSTMKNQQNNNKKMNPKSNTKNKQQKANEQTVRKISDVLRTKETYADYLFYINQYNKILESPP